MFQFVESQSVISISIWADSITPVCLFLKLYERQIKFANLPGFVDIQPTWQSIFLQCCFDITRIGGPDCAFLLTSSELHGCTRVGPTVTQKHFWVSLLLLKVLYVWGKMFYPTFYEKGWSHSVQDKIPGDFHVFLTFIWQERLHINIVRYINHGPPYLGWPAVRKRGGVRSHTWPWHSGLARGVSNTDLGWGETISGSCTWSWSGVGRLNPYPWTER